MELLEYIIVFPGFVNILIRAFTINIRMRWFTGDGWHIGLSID